MVPGGRRKLCKAVNLSATGVFIETTNLGLRKGQQVVLAFALNLGAVTKLHRRTAVVAHVSRGGTGLMMESSGAARSSCRARLRAPPAASARRRTEPLATASFTRCSGSQAKARPAFTVASEASRLP